MGKLLDYYFEYMESYVYSFNGLYQLKNNEQFFYPLGMIYTNFMELWIKYCIMNFAGTIDEYTINDFGIDGHNFTELLKDEDTLYEFDFNGVKKDEINDILKGVEDIKKLLSCAKLSFAFRYPCNMDNKVYMNLINNKKKKKVIDLMYQSITKSVKIIIKYTAGVSDNLLTIIQKCQSYKI